MAHAGERKAYKTKLRGYFDNTGINPDAVPEKSLTSANKLKTGIKQLSTLFSKNGNPSLSVGDGDYGDRNQTATFYRKENSITLWGAAFDTNYTLAATMFHEATHAYFNFIGLSASWDKAFFDCGTDINEYNAYRLGFEIAPDMFYPGSIQYNNSMNGNYYGNGNMNHWQAAYNLFK